MKQTKVHRIKLCVTDSEAGPSGIQIQRQQPIKLTISYSTCSDGDDNPKEVNPYQLFADKVTIAGLPEAYGHEFLSDRIMFRIGLIISFIAIIFGSIAIVHQYRNQETVHIDNILREQPPFPTITICSAININLTKVQTSIGNEKQDELIRKYNVTMDDAVSYIEKIFSIDVSFQDRGTPPFKAAKELIKEILDVVSNAKTNLVEFFIPPCVRLFSNCEYRNRQFDCCEGAALVATLHHFCYQIKMPDTSEQLDIDASIFKFEITTDTSRSASLENAQPSDGFHIYVGKLPSEYDVPVHVPAGMEIMITLSEPTKLKQLDDCYRDDNTPKLAYFNDYDKNGAQCLADILVNAIREQVNCTIPMSTYFPNETCGFDQMYAISIGVSGAYNVIQEKLVLETVEKNDKLTLSHLKTLLFHQCLPLCSRWSYPVFSASFNAIQYKTVTKQHQNDVLSRINIIMPYSSYWTRVEKPTSVTYLEMCEISGMMGVYTGVSMITFIQIFAFGGYIIWWKVQKWRDSKRKVATDEIIR